MWKNWLFGNILSRDIGGILWLLLERSYFSGKNLIADEYDQKSDDNRWNLIHNTLYKASKEVWKNPVKQIADTVPDDRGSEDNQKNRGCFQLS